jgi:hypothetical protein
MRCALYLHAATAPLLAALERRHFDGGRLLRPILLLQALRNRHAGPAASAGDACRQHISGSRAWEAGRQKRMPHPASSCLGNPSDVNANHTPHEHSACMDRMGVESSHYN